MYDGAKTCNCRTVVTRVYRELRDRNIPVPSAFDTATRIFRLHHPETLENDARHTISGWLE
jgi:hypothetical protein